MRISKRWQNDIFGRTVIDLTSTGVGAVMICLEWVPIHLNSGQTSAPVLGRSMTWQPVYGSSAVMKDKLTDWSIIVTKGFCDSWRIDQWPLLLLCQSYIWNYSLTSGLTLHRTLSYLIIQFTQIKNNFRIEKKFRKWLFHKRELLLIYSVSQMWVDERKQLK